MDVIKIQGAREHNLKNINLSLPKNKFIVFSGISGSGKSSLAFDTIYAEGQRRYVESLSSYARQFLGIMNKPDVDFIEGLSPAIAIDQKSKTHNPRSTVGTVTEIYDYLRLLYARIGHPHCPICNREITKQSADQITDQIIILLQKEATLVKRPVRAFILSPVVRERKGEFTKLFDNIKAKGYTSARIDGRIYNLAQDLFLIKTNKHTIEIVVDKISLSKKQLEDKISLSTVRGRIFDSLNRALELSNGSAILSFVNDASFTFPQNPKKYTDCLYSEKFACPVDNIDLSEIEPRTFSFNSPQGACPNCSGIGTLLKINPEIVLNPRLSVSEGGILPYGRIIDKDTWYTRLIRTVCEENGINTREPLAKISLQQKDIILYGTGDRIYQVEGTNRFGRLTSIEEEFIGVVGDLENRYKQTESDWVRTEIEKYMYIKECPACRGNRLKKEVLSITIDQKSIIEVTKQSIDKALAWVKKIKEDKNILSERERYIASQIINEIETRLQFLISVGLDYITIDRSAYTLAGGEAQRIRLASQIGSGLTGVLYVLDEPSIGLHQKDNAKLINTLIHLRDIGNTVIVVEHDRDTILASDLVVDFGPGAGDHGGKIVAFGTPKEIAGNNNSLTGKYLARKKIIQLPTKINFLSSKKLTIRGCLAQNLKNIDVELPLGKLICITGVSGSGKSTFLEGTLYHGLARELNPYHRIQPGKYRTIEGLENIKRVSLIDQSPIGRTPRSNPCTYTGTFGYIRQLFSQTPAARSLGLNQGYFSFNVKGGRCEACEGDGQIKIEMQFMSDIYVTCEVCHGSRYNNTTLEVYYKNKNISDVLNLTVEEALDLFRNIPVIQRKLKTLADVGLSYIKLGQPAPTLSGGEAQRVKLATELAKSVQGHTIYLLDEPTTGLHFADLEKLLWVLRLLVDKGNTVCVIEHNFDVIKNADWIIDLGPDGGNKGGEIVASGTPQQVSKIKKSYTGQFLKKEGF